LTGTGLAINATQGSPFNGNVATFDDQNLANVAGDFSATIDWGDGVITAGTLSGGPATFTVAGSHTYAKAGLFPVTVTMSDVDDDGSGQAIATATANTNANVAANGNG